MFYFREDHGDGLILHVQCIHQVCSNLRENSWTFFFLLEVLIDSKVEEETRAEWKKSLASWSDGK